MSFNANKFWIPDGGSGSLSSIVVSRTGGGKSTWLRSTLLPTLGKKNSVGHRVIYVSPKMEDIFKDTPKSIPHAMTTQVSAIPKLMQKNQIITYIPTDPNSYDEDIDAIVEMVFALQDANPTTKINKKETVKNSFNIIIDDAQILNGFSARKEPSSAIKKLTIGGRSKCITGIFIVHRYGALPRLMSGNCANLISLSTSSVDQDITKRLFGISMEEYEGQLTDFRWLHTDLLVETTTKYEKVDII